MGRMKFLPLILFFILLPSEGFGATVRGRIVSERIRNFENFVVYIKKVDEANSEKVVEVVKSVQAGNKVIPHVLPVAKGSKILFVNKDPHLHNLNTGIQGPVRFNIGIPPGGEYGPMKFRREGIVRLSCNIHPEVTGVILVLQNRFFSNVDGKGNFIIKNVPAGRFEIVTWHEEYKSLSENIEITDEKSTKLVRFRY